MEKFNCSLGQGELSNHPKLMLYKMDSLFYLFFVGDSAYMVSTSKERVSTIVFRYEGPSGTLGRFATLVDSYRQPISTRTKTTRMVKLLLRGDSRYHPFRPKLR